jgi:hypothetical protein
MRMKFRNLPDQLRPSSEVGIVRHAQADAGLDMISSAIERWRGATMSSKPYEDDGYDSGYAPREEAPPIQPAPQTPAPSGFDPQRSRILKAPLSAALGSTDLPKTWRP